MSIALHACCCPCLIEPLDALREGDDVVVVFSNPNIAPPDEYVRRRDTLRAYAETVAADVVELAHEADLWRSAVAGLERDQPVRCAACYRLRLGMTADWAARHEISRIATTLTVSPYQDAESIRRAGEEAAGLAGVEYVHHDFRDRYPSASARARELGLYRQNYCGCFASQKEAEETRARRRAEREAARLEGHAARPEYRLSARG